MTGGIQCNAYALRFVPTLSVAADGFVHIAELSAHVTNSSSNTSGAVCFMT